MSVRIRESATPTTADARRAWESLEPISEILTSGKSDVSIHIRNEAELGA
jgi:hypothetical protein